MSPSLPFLRLPYLPMKQLLDHMDFQDIVNLSVCSEKTRVVILSTKKFATMKSILEKKQNKRETVMDVLRLLRLYLSTRKFVDEVVCDVQITNFKLNIIISFPKTSEISTELLKRKEEFPNWYFSKNHCLEVTSTMLIDLINYFKMTLKLQINRLSIDLKDRWFFQENSLKVFANWMSSSSTVVKELNFESEKLDDKYLSQILYHIDAWDTFNIDIKTSFQFECLRYFKSENFELKSGGWFTFYNLQLVDCAQIKIMDSQLTNCNMKDYLKQWIDGNFDELRHLDVEMRELTDEEYLLDGMSPGSFTREKNSIAFKRSDGKTAIMESSPEVMTNWFKISVY